jgi:hypothetical protein
MSQREGIWFTGNSIPLQEYRQFKETLNFVIPAICVVETHVGERIIWYSMQLLVCKPDVHPVNAGN